jgi:hypothetical protein
MFAGMTEEQSVHRFHVAISLLRKLTCKESAVTTVLRKLRRRTSYFILRFKALGFAIGEIRK